MAMEDVPEVNVSVLFIFKVDLLLSKFFIFSSRQRRFVLKFVRVGVCLFDWTQPCTRRVVNPVRVNPARRLVQVFPVDKF